MGGKKTSSRTAHPASAATLRLPASRPMRYRSMLPYGLRGRHAFADLFTYATGEVGRGEAFAYWRELICDVFVNLDCSTSEAVAFGGMIATQPMAEVQLSTMTTQRLRKRTDSTRKRSTLQTLSFA
jgi:hypothetical protein